MACQHLRGGIGQCGSLLCPVGDPVGLVGDPWIGEPGAGGAHEDIGRSHVPVNRSGSVKRCERVGYFDADFDDLGSVQTRSGGCQGGTADGLCGGLIGCGCGKPIMEGFRHLSGGGEPLVRVLCHCPHHDRLELQWDRRQTTRGLRVRGHMGDGDRHRAVTGEWRHSGEHLVEHYPQRVDVGGGGGLLSRSPLWGHVADRS